VRQVGHCNRGDTFIFCMKRISICIDNLYSAKSLYFSFHLFPSTDKAVGFVIVYIKCNTMKHNKIKV
jgi:hypothetical protein